MLEQRSGLPSITSTSSLAVSRYQATGPDQPTHSVATTRAWDTSAYVSWNLRGTAYTLLQGILNMAPRRYFNSRLRKAVSEASPLHDLEWAPVTEAKTDFLFSLAKALLRAGLLLPRSSRLTTRPYMRRIDLPESHLQGR